jgi:hypothetical protein
MKRPRVPAFTSAIVLTGCVVGTIFACSPAPDPTRTTEVNVPQFSPGFTGDGDRTGVTTFLERRCGTLDCHGQMGRPLRIYGALGLRLVDEAGAVPGGSGTSADEKLANFYATVTLEPELMTQVVNNGGDGADRLLLVRKPRQLERHKGGQVIVANDSGDTCLTSWLQGNTDFAACAIAAKVSGP